MTKPLEGVRIIDMSNILMTPYTTQILGDMGADVIKLEPPEGDPIRGIGPLRNPGMGAFFLNANRSKRSIVLNLKTQCGLEAALALIKEADVLIYNRRPAAMKRLGLSYEVVSKLNPRLIYVGMYGYSEEGRYGDLPAFDDLIQAAVGLPSLTQQIGAERPIYMPTLIADRSVGLWGVGQVSAALFHQSRTGRGQKIDIPMFEMMASFVLGDHLGGETFQPAIGPMGYPRLLAKDRRPYQTKDGHICVLVYTDRHWRAFFKALGQEEKFDADPRFKSLTTRTENVQSIYGELADLLVTRTTGEWVDFFEKADIPAVRMQTIETLLQDPHLRETGFFQTAEHPTEGKITEIAFPTTWSETQPGPSRPVPRLGEHTTEVLAEVGYTAQDMAGLVQGGGTLPPETTPPAPDPEPARERSTV